MKALILRKNAELIYDDVPDPVTTMVGRGSETTAANILVKVAYSGICGSDIPRAFKGKAYHYPLVMGHEFSGTVVEAPSSSAYKRGDRVVVFPLIPCRHCTACATGDFAQCANYDYYGSRRDGGFAEYVRVGEANLFPVPDHVDLRSAAMTEPCAVALHGVEKLSIHAGMSALVLGGGPIGNMVAQWLRLKGCDPIYVADIDSMKRDIASEMGFIPIDSSQVDPAEELRRNEVSGGVDCVVEAVGLPATFLQAVQCAGRFGQIVFMGNINGTFQVPEADFSRILRHEIRISGTWNSRVEPRGKDDWTTVLRFLDDRIKVKPLISHEVPLSEGPAMFEKVVSKKEWINKVMFTL
ncbi:MAG TPA: galactitol-1-phosphate 5-dehydrogenase [Spirochaetales bacterium]|nr:galactitol-1-phosphate 5-dehydrogenase [Spirochaetales bacterium]